MFVLWKTKPHNWCLSKETCSTCSICHNFYHYPKAKRKRKQKHPISVRIVRLDFDASCIQNVPTLSSKPTPCFLLPIMIKGGKSTTMWTQAFLNLGASTCFINKSWYDNITSHWWKKWHQQWSKWSMVETFFQDL